MEEGLNISVFNFLQRHHSGRKNAIKAGQLAQHFSVGLRDINEIIRILRKEGKLIGSSKIPPFGYYIPANENEVKDHLHCFKNELLDMLETYNRQRRAQKDYFNRNQQELFPAEYNTKGQMEII